VSPDSTPTRILIVDDDVGLLVLMAEILRNEGYSVDTAGSGTAAFLGIRTARPDLMLLDLKLKDIGGAALLERLKREAARVPFVVITGQGDEKAAVEMMKEGALDYVMKDTGLLDLLPAVVRRAVGTVRQERALARAEAEGRRLEAMILEAGERERLRIGNDLHDGLGQQLTAIELYCTGLKDDAGRLQPELADRLDQMGGMLREAVALTRSLARGLVPVGDEPDALQTGLAELAERTSALGSLRCRLECPEPVLLNDPAAAGHLYRIVQEALNNVMKHARASEVVIRLERVGGVLRLQAIDDGKGMTAAGGQGMGLEVMKHRASVIGAALTVVSKRNRGVTVTCTLPLKP
jgi:signal transduction histidine kinase